MRTYIYIYIRTRTYIHIHMHTHIFFFSGLCLIAQSPLRCSSYSMAAHLQITLSVDPCKRSHMKPHSIRSLIRKLLI